eukprot:comp18593_c2_seq1/m.20135 comp18593_c2_seq1/g.20135  ORF comp18593_c2_seq1/g.20135 comp18593_c2_seq1/m.20135 type:complete len:189 (-) comp18593_c2_seq1:511-1077(-)
MPRSADIFHTYKYPFEQVAETYWNKHSETPEVVEIRIEEQHLDAECLKTKRVAKVENTAPALARRLLGHKYFYVEEDIELNSHKRTMTTFTQNQTYIEYGHMYEKSEYAVSEENPNWTTLKQRGTVDVYGCGPFINSMLEMFIVRYCTHGAHEGIKVMEKLLERHSKDPSATQGIIPGIKQSKPEAGA